MTNKNPNAWEYDHEHEWNYPATQAERRYRIIQVVRERDELTAFYDDPEHPKVKI